VVVSAWHLRYRQPEDGGERRRAIAGDGGKHREYYRQAWWREIGIPK